MTLEPRPPARRPAADPAPDEGGGVLGSALKFAGFAARTGYGIAKRVPGVGVAERGLQELERGALNELRKRIEHAAEPDAPTLRLAQAPVPGGAPVITQHGDFEPLRATMAELLQRALGQSTAQAREELYASILRQLSPDEARVLAALSDGSQYALIDVAERAGVGGVGRYLLRNMSSIGTEGGLTLPEHVPYYVGRLVALGLAERGDESAKLGDQYDILLTDATVRTALESAKRAKVIRQTLQITAFGKVFWRACDPSEWA